MSTIYVLGNQQLTEQEKHELFGVYATSNLFEPSSDHDIQHYRNELQHGVYNHMLPTTSHQSSNINDNSVIYRMTRQLYHKLDITQTNHVIQFTIDATQYHTIDQLLSVADQTQQYHNIDELVELWNDVISNSYVISPNHSHALLQQLYSIYSQCTSNSHMLMYMGTLILPSILYIVYKYSKPYVNTAPFSNDCTASIIPMTDRDLLQSIHLPVQDRLELFRLFQQSELNNKTIDETATSQQANHIFLYIAYALLLLFTAGYIHHYLILYNSAKIEQQTRSNLMPPVGCYGEPDTRHTIIQLITSPFYKSDTSNECIEYYQLLMKSILPNPFESLISYILQSIFRPSEIIAKHLGASLYLLITALPWYLQLSSAFIIPAILCSIVLFIIIIVQTGIPSYIFSCCRRRSSNIPTSSNTPHPIQQHPAASPGLPPQISQSAADRYSVSYRTMHNLLQAAAGQNYIVNQLQRNNIQNHNDIEHIESSVSIDNDDDYKSNESIQAQQQRSKSPLIIHNINNILHNASSTQHIKPTKHNSSASISSRLVITKQIEGNGTTAQQSPQPNIVRTARNDRGYDERSLRSDSVLVVDDNDAFQSDINNIDTILDNNHSNNNMLQHSRVQSDLIEFNNPLAD